jgi:CDP-diacylglycerol--serine O-phosphatidyltransferase
MLLGLGAIFLMVQANASGIASDAYFNFAGWLIVLAAVMDGLDGKVARKMGTSSEFGVQFDTLADLTAFGVAPSVLLYVRFIGSTSSPLIVVPMFFLVASAFRLARFNATTGGKRKTHFSGMPTTVAGPMLAAFTMFANFWHQHGILQLSPSQQALIALVLAAINGLLMISSIPFATFPPMFFKLCNMPVRLLILLVIFAGIYKYAGITLLTVGIAYQLESIVPWIWKTLVRGRDSDEIITDELIEDVEEEEEPMTDSINPRL